MKYKFKITYWGIHGPNEDFEKEIQLSDSEVATIKQLVLENMDDWPTGLMPILYKGPEDLFDKIHDAIIPHVFFLAFQEVYGTNDFEPEPGDENRYWDEDEDVDYLYEKYGLEFDLEDEAYTVYIPDDMKPPKMKIHKGMSKENMLRYIRNYSSLPQELFDEISSKHGMYNSTEEELQYFIEEKLISLFEQSIKENDEATLSQDDFNPFENVDVDTLSDKISDEFQKKYGEDVFL